MDKITEITWDEVVDTIYPPPKGGGKNDEQ